MKLITNQVCDICGKRRGRRGDRGACSKQRQAKGGVTTEFLIRTGDRS